MEAVDMRREDIFWPTMANPLPPSSQTNHHHDHHGIITHRRRFVCSGTWRWRRWLVSPPPAPLANHHTRDRGGDERTLDTNPSFALLLPLDTHIHT